MAKRKNDLDIVEWVAKLDDRLDKIDITLTKQEENLRLHMYRTDLAEKRLEHIEKDLRPVKEHVSLVKQASKILAWLLGSGILLAIGEKLLNGN